jgi:hypothetical protein
VRDKFQTQTALKFGVRQSMVSMLLSKFGKRKTMNLPLAKYLAKQTKRPITDFLSKRVHYKGR